MKPSRIIAVHLLNDRSGSPFVLRQSLEVLAAAGYRVELFTATPSGDGFLSHIPGVKEHRIFYRWSTSKWFTLMMFCYSQFLLFMKVLWHINKKDIVYINSLLPFGAALAAKLRGCKVLYHIHEVSIKPALLKQFLLGVANLTAARGIFVSDDLRKRTAFRPAASVVYNSLPASFIQEAFQHRRSASAGFTVLMLCSLKKYKGVWEFVECARRLPGLSFRLVLNASSQSITEFFKGQPLPANLELQSATKNVHSCYRQASVVMNLSKPDEWVETFGMTILEAMYYQKPVIVPTVGGVIELVEDGEQGYRINSTDVDAIGEKLQLLYADEDLYTKLSVQAYQKAQQFTPVQFRHQLLQQLKLMSVKNDGKEGGEKLVQLTLF